MHLKRLARNILIWASFVGGDFSPRGPNDEKRRLKPAPTMLFRREIFEPSGPVAHIPQVKPLGQLGAAGQEAASELEDEVLAKVDSILSTS